MSVEVLRPADRTAWLAERRKDLTASDIGAVAGVDRYRSALRVYAEKTGQFQDDSDNNMMRRGRWLEPAVIEALRERFPTWDIRRAGVYLRDTEIRMGATPDCIAEDGAEPGIINVQCKVVAKPIFEKEWDDGRAPLKYQLQTLAEGLMLNARTSLIAALVIDTFSAELVVDEVPRHADAEARVREIVKTFWADIAAGRQPKVDYQADGELLSSMYPEHQPGKTIDLRADNRMPVLLAERADLKARIKADSERVDDLDTEIKSKMGDAEEALVPGFKLTWKTQHRKEYTVEASTIRPLRVTDRREKGNG